MSKRPVLSSSLCLTALLLGATALVAGCGDDSPAGGGGSGGEAAGGEGGGGGTQLDPLAIDVPAGEWSWVEFPESSCMDGTPTGIGVNPHPTSDDVVIFLMGGNACFNLASCLVVAHKDGYGQAEFDEEKTEIIDVTDFFDRDNPANPFREFSYVFVPYCSGDVFAGDKADVTVAGDVYQFHGYANMTRFLERVVPTFPDAARVVLTGVSAGGFGAAYNYDHVATAFGEDVKVTLIDDSGPPMGTEFVPECLQQVFIETWGTGATLPADCTECDAGGVWLEPYVNFILDKYPERSFGVISSDADSTIRNFWGFGENDCASLGGPPDPYDPAKYRAGLEDLRDRIGEGTRLRLFMVPGDEHVFSDNGLDAVEVDGVLMEDWIQQAIDEDPAWPNVSEPPL